jgi:hypothetical protein
MSIAVLAVDLGLRSGLAAFDEAGELVWYRSTNFGDRGRLRRAVTGVLDKLPDLELVALEGDRQLGEAWERVAIKRGAEVVWVTAETWRETLLTPSQRRSGSEAKRAADVIARDIIRRSAAPNPTSLRHDAAEAILIGVWACRQHAQTLGEGGKTA